MKTYNSYYGTSTYSPAYSDGDISRIINNTSTNNLNWGLEQVNDATRYLTQKYYLNEKTYTVPGGTVAQQQFYNLPSDIKKVITATVTIGSVVWQPKECSTWNDWNALNVQTFYNDFPLYFFIKANRQIGIWPTPSSNGNTITIPYKARIIDLSMPDVTDATAGTTTITATQNSTTVTASSSLFKQWMAGQWLRISFNATDANSGDNQWYLISSVTNSTTLVLANQYTGNTVTSGNSAGNFTIGQVSILPEDYQDLPLYRMGYIYYTTRFPDATRAKLYQDLWKEGEAKLNDEFGSKTTNVVLQDLPLPIMNPNLFQKSLTQN